MGKEKYRLRYSENPVFMWLKKGVQSRLEFSVIYFAGSDSYAGIRPTARKFRFSSNKRNRCKDKTDDYQRNNKYY